MKVLYFGNNLFSNCLTFMVNQGFSVEAVYINDVEENASIVKRICGILLSDNYGGRSSDNYLGRLI